MDDFRGYFWSFFVLFNILSFALCQTAEPTCLEGAAAKEYNEKLVQDHNKYRSLHGTPPLEADDKLLTGATEWSKGLVVKDGLVHSDGEDGENLYTSVSTGPLNEAEIDPVKPWYDEIKLYKKPEFTLETGHFTQVVWRDTRKVGCGLCSIPQNGSTKVVVTCRYSPSGNVQGQFEENVPPLKSTGDSSTGSDETTLPGSTKQANDIDNEKTTVGTAEITSSETSESTTDSNETTSAGEETTSNGKGTTSGGEVTTSASEGTTPASVGTTPAREETTSGGKETTSTSVETTPASEETTSASKGTSATTTEPSKPTTESMKTTSADDKTTTSADDKTTTSADDKTTTTATTPKPHKNSDMIEEILFITTLAVLILCLVPLGILLMFVYKQNIYL